MVIFDEVHLVSETATTLRKVFDKLRSKLAGKIGGYYHHTHNIRTSAFTFKHNENWYKVSIRVDEISNDEKQFFIKQKYEDDND